ncbi:hypothetical protein PCYB_001690 [Plasmodium cynomolgi strain B]|uniref:Uncharacterized protein n=1 Tax=Plasmodium cynomolgi (strain B) TaxID=1120755 RepID=K6UF37_PLACD|nr:hypothetical protein PCYB_001690 [Plasmodium cynomolgi strain B]GAB69421.1 hypothetical protein PCYB_001690 [Plasmodium cynomolgi strain B]
MCNNISNDGVVDNIHKNEYFDNVCQVAIYYLSHLYNKYRYNNDDMNEGCKYLYYAIYNNILEKKYKNYDELFKFYKSILIEHNNHDEWDSNKIYINKIERDILEKNNNLIEIYDYFDNFKDSITNKIGIPCEYAENWIEKYNKRCMENVESKEESSCLKIIQFKEKYYKHMENYFPCDNLQRYFPYIGKNNQKFIFLIPIILITLKLSILYIIYNVRSCINPKKMKKKRSIYDLLQESQNRENDSNRRPYNIAYSL